MRRGIYFFYLKPVGQTDLTPTTHAHAPRGARTSLLVGPLKKNQIRTKKAEELSQRLSGLSLEFGVPTLVRTCYHTGKDFLGLLKDPSWRHLLGTARETGGPDRGPESGTSVGICVLKKKVYALR